MVVPLGGADGDVIVVGVKLSHGAPRSRSSQWSTSKKWRLRGKYFLQVVPGCKKVVPHYIERNFSSYGADCGTTIWYRGIVPFLRKHKTIIIKHKK